MDARIYLAFFQAIRSVNRDLPRQKRLRVLALDPPVLWDSVQTADAIPRNWGHRDPVWFEILEKEVFALHHKALVIAGALHIIRRDPVARFQAAPLAKAGLGDAIAQRYPSAAYAVYPLLGSAGLAALVRHWNPGSLGDVQGTSLGARSSHELLPGHFTLFTMVNGKRVPRLPEESAYPPIDGLVDAVVYDGPDPSTAPLLLTPYRRARYVAEMHRRSRIVQPIFGQDLDATIDSLARRACTAVQRGGVSPARGCPFP